MNKRLVILSGPACVGKGPLQAAVNRLYPGLIDARPILCTSRPPRKAELHGKDYFFLPADFIRSLEAAPDFVVSPVRTDWQAIHLPQVETLLQANDIVFAEVFYTFGPVLLKRASSRQFDTISVFLHPLPLTAPQEHITATMHQKLSLRGTDPPDKVEDRAASAPQEMLQSMHYTHRVLNPAGEEDIEEWKSLGTRDGKKGRGEVNSLADLGPNAKWLVETFVTIARGGLPPGDYSRPRRFRVIWHDYQDGCSHCSVFESADTEPEMAAIGYLLGLGEVAKYGYEIESAKEVSEDTPLGHEF